MQEGGGGNGEASLKLVLADIIADVSAADAAQLCPSADGTDTSAPEDSLMDEDFADAAPQPSSSAANGAGPVPNILDSAFGLAAGEYEDLMRSLEESLFEDVRRDEAAFLAEHERWEAAAADSDLSMLVRPPLSCGPVPS